MPYEISFTKAISDPNSDIYINECCYGGDVVSEQLLPAIREQYGDLQADQEDWGWFIWFRDRQNPKVRLAVDIFCDDPETGAFRIRVTSRKKGWLSSAIADTPELDRLKEIVVGQVELWVGSAPEVEQVED